MYIGDYQHIEKMYGIITTVGGVATCAGIYPCAETNADVLQTAILQKYLSQKYPENVVKYVQKIPNSCAEWEIGTILVERDVAIPITIHRVIQKEIAGWIGSALKRRNELICEVRIVAFDASVLTDYARGVSHDISREVLRAHGELGQLNTVIAKLEQAAKHDHSIITCITNSLEQSNEENVKLRGEISELESELKRVQISFDHERDNKMVVESARAALEEQLIESQNTIHTLDTRLDRLVKEFGANNERSKIIANINQPIAPRNNTVVNTSSRKITVGDIHHGEEVIDKDSLRMDYDQRRKNK